MKDAIIAVAVIYLPVAVIVVVLYGLLPFFPALQYGDWIWCPPGMLSAPSPSTGEETCYKRCPRPMIRGVNALGHTACIYDLR